MKWKIISLWTSAIHSLFAANAFVPQAIRPVLLLMSIVFSLSAFGKTATICGNDPVPDGWVVVATGGACSANGITKSVSRTIRYIGNMPAGETITLCGTQAIPAGWIVTSIGGVCNSYDNYKSFYMTITKIDGAPKCTIATLCGNQYVPAGWVVIANGSNPCTSTEFYQYNYNQHYYPRTIKKIDGPKQNQTITFISVSGKSMCSQPFTISATAKGEYDNNATGFPVTLSLSSNPQGIATLSSGNKVTILGAGTVTITGSVSGNADCYNPATQSVSFTVAPSTLYRDADGDSYGDPNNAITPSVLTAGYVCREGDCDDNNPTIHSGAPEFTDGLDNDCNGLVDAPPTGLAVSGVTNSSASVSWNASAYAVSYTLLYKTAAATLWTTVQNLTATSYHLTNIVLGTAYTVQVRAVYNAGISGVSLPVSFTTPCNKIPAGLTSTNITSNAATVSWGAIAGAARYNLQWRNAASTTWNTQSVTGASSYNLTNLPNGTTFYFKVQTVCNAGTSSYSDSAVFNTVCSPPVWSSGQSVITQTSARLYWTADAGDKTYSMRWKPASDTTWRLKTGITKAADTLSGLAPGDPFIFQLARVCVNNSTSSWSADNRFSTICAVVTTLNVNSVGSNSASLSWNAVPGAKSYTLQYKTASDAGWIQVPGIATTSYSLANLKSGNTYTVQVQTVCNGGASGFSPPVSFTTSCKVPTGLAAANITGTSADLLWTAFPEAVSYTVQWKAAAATTWITKTGLTAASYTVTGLSGSTSYNFRVLAVCSMNSSSYSTAATFTTIACNTPSGLSADKIGYNSASLKWVAVPGAKGYRLQWKAADAITWNTTPDLTVAYYELGNLSSGTAYTFQVATLCNSDNSSYSAPASFTTSCGHPSGIKAQNITGTSATASWDALPGAKSYTLQWKAASSGSWTAVTGLTAPSYNLSSLTPGTGYYLRVMAACNTGSSNYSDSATFITSLTTAWMSGDNTPNKYGIYGTKGIAAAGNKPGAREQAISWTDAAGNLWLMGGNGYASSATGLLNDLWKFTPSTGLWTWVSGDNTPNKFGSYGIKGVAEESNKPGSRDDAVSWTDAAGNLWLMGGWGYAITNTNILTSSTGYLNDLWKFTPSTGLWTWISGDNTLNKYGSFGTRGFAAVSNKPGAREQAISWTDAAGNLWLMGGKGHASTTTGLLNDLWKFTPSTGLWTWVSGDNTPNKFGSYGTKGIAEGSNKPGARDDAVSWTDTAGNLWLMGGWGYAITNTSILSSSTGYLNDLWKFTPSTGLWTWVSGDNTLDKYGSFGTRGFAAAGNKPGAREQAISWTDVTGNLWLMGGKGYAGSNSTGNLNDVWRFTLATGLWTWVSGGNTLNNYGGYGTKGIASENNKPGAREQAISWTDATGNLWLMGGWGYAITSTSILINNTGLLNDLWKLTLPSAFIFYRDADGDGFGSSADKIQTATPAPPAGYVATGNDCNDNNNKIYPGATEVVNGVDDNCNGVIDESFVTLSVPGKAMEETTNSLAVKIAPNPFTHRFTLTIHGSSNKPVQVRVLNMLGGLVEKKNNVAANSVLQLGGHYRPGTYLVEVVQGTEKKVVKIVRQ